MTPTEGVTTSHSPFWCRRGKTTRKRHLGMHGPPWFTRDVLPAPSAASLTTIARATGMSTSAASRVRSDQRVPHPRHWEPLAELVGVGVTSYSKAGGAR